MRRTAKHGIHSENVHQGFVSNISLIEVDREVHNLLDDEWEKDNNDQVAEQCNRAVVTIRMSGNNKKQWSGKK